MYIGRDGRRCSGHHFSHTLKSFTFSEDGKAPVFANTNVGGDDRPIASAIFFSKYTRFFTFSHTKFYSSDYAPYPIQTLLRVNIPVDPSTIQPLRYKYTLGVFIYMFNNEQQHTFTPLPPIFYLHKILFMQ